MSPPLLQIAVALCSFRDNISQLCLSICDYHFGERKPLLIKRVKTIAPNADRPWCANENFKPLSISCGEIAPVLLRWITLFIFECHQVRKAPQRKSVWQTAEYRTRTFFEGPDLTLCPLHVLVRRYWSHQRRFEIENHSLEVEAAIDDVIVTDLFL